MPQIRIEHSANLAGGFDGRALALAIHGHCVDQVKATMAACKSRVLDMGEVIIADGAGEGAMLHVDIGILKGRTTEAKAGLSEAVLAELRKAAEASGVAGVNISCEVRDVDTDAYRKDVLA